MNCHITWYLITKVFHFHSIKFREKRLSALKKILNPCHSFLHRSTRQESIEFASRSYKLEASRKKSRKFERITPSRMNPLCHYLRPRLRTNAKSPRLSFSTLPSSPFLTTSSIQPPWNKYNERDVAGVEREISYTRLRDRYSWLPARNTGVGKASGNVETRIKADPASLFLLIYLFIYFFLISYRQI